jgi:phage terminase small subunit
VKVRKDWNFDLNARDSITKFVLAHSFVVVRNKKACRAFLRQIKNNCYPQIKARYLQEKYKSKDKRNLITFVCDKFSNYKDAFNKLFYRVANLEFGVSIARKKHGLKHNNNPIERYNGKIDDRLESIRGGFGSFEGAKAFMNMSRVINNFVNPCQQLQGKTPAETAGIFLPLGENKLLSLIRYLAKNTHHSLR